MTFRLRRAKAPAPELHPDWLLRAALRDPEPPQEPVPAPADCGMSPEWQRSVLASLAASHAREHRPPAPLPGGPFRVPWGLPDGTRPFCHPVNYGAADRVVFGPAGVQRRTTAHADRVRRRIRKRADRQSSGTVELEVS